MKQSGYILAIDQGTTSTTAVLVDGSGRPLWTAREELPQIYPRPAWVEHDPEDIFSSCMAAVEELLEETEVDPRQVRALGIANQRETTVVWERDTGRPVCNAIVWQCRRTAPLCDAMKARGLEDTVRVSHRHNLLSIFLLGLHRRPKVYLVAPGAARRL